MEIKFWGVRGSIPSPLDSGGLITKLKTALQAANGRHFEQDSQLIDFIGNLPKSITHPIGGNTACLEIKHHNTILIFDAGSGIRRLGNYLVEKYFNKFEKIEADIENSNAELNLNTSKNMVDGSETTLSLFLSHTHWDHIQGFPFFAPAYIKSANIDIYGLRKDLIHKAFENHYDSPYMFPININAVPSKIKFFSFPNEGLKMKDVLIECFPLPHPGGSLAYKVTIGGKKVVYATDYEYSGNNKFHDSSKFIEFIKGADIFISDSQYTHSESAAKEGWGHSTSFWGVDISARAEVKSLYLFHHDPEHSDEKLYNNLDKTILYKKRLKSTYPLEIHLATEESIVTL